MHIDLTGKRALVTGAASGIGEASALAFAEAGASVAVHARHIEKASLTVEKIESSGGKAFAVEADLADESAVKAMCNDAIEGLAGIDIVFNNAGVHDLADFVDSDQQVWNQIMAINLDAPRLITQLTIPVMRAQGTGGRQLYTSSLSAIMAEMQASAYCASKAALNSMARCLAIEVGQYGITVNTLNPGWVNTPMGRAGFELMQEEGRLLDNEVESGMSDNLLGIAIEPHDISAIATFLASDLGRCITGQDINVCAGMSLLSFE